MRFSIFIAVLLLISCGINYDLKKCANNSLYAPVAMLTSLNRERYSAKENLCNFELLKAYFPNECGTNSIKLIDTSRIVLDIDLSPIYYMAKYSQCERFYFLIVGPNYLEIENSIYEFDNVSPPSIGYPCFSISPGLNHSESSLSRIWHQLFVLPLLPKTDFPNEKWNWKSNARSMHVSETLERLNSVREFIDDGVFDKHPHIEYFKLVFYPKLENARFMLADNSGRIGMILATTSDSLYTLKFHREQPYCFTFTGKMRE